MTLFRAFGLLPFAVAGAIALADAPRVAIVGDRSMWVGGKPVETQTVSRILSAYLGHGSSVEHVSSGSSDLLRLEPRIVLLNAGWSESQLSGWIDRRDSFVPRMVASIRAVQRIASMPRVIVLLPSEGSKRTASELIPLLRQASREAGAEAFDLGRLEPAGVTDLATLAAGELALVISDRRESKKSWRVVSATSEEADEGPARMAIDGDPETYWHSRYSNSATKVPHELVVDLGKTTEIRGFRYLPRQDGGVNGRVLDYEFYVSQDGARWAEPVAKGRFANTLEPSRAMLPKPIACRFVRFVALSEVNGGPWTSMAELDVIPSRPPGN